MRGFTHILFLAPSLAQACPNCYGSGPFHSGLVKATLFLMPVPFIVAAALFVFLRRRSRKLEEDGHGTNHV